MLCKNVLVIENLYKCNESAPPWVYIRMFLSRCGRVALQQQRWIKGYFKRSFYHHFGGFSLLWTTDIYGQLLVKTLKKLYTVLFASTCRTPLMGSFICFPGGCTGKRWGRRVHQGIHSDSTRPPSRGASPWCQPKTRRPCECPTRKTLHALVLISNTTFKTPPFFFYFTAEIRNKLKCQIKLNHPINLPQHVDVTRHTRGVKSRPCCTWVMNTHEWWSRDTRSGGRADPAWCETGQRLQTHTPNAAFTHVSEGGAATSHYSHLSSPLMRPKPFLLIWSLTQMFFLIGWEGREGRAAVAPSRPSHHSCVMRLVLLQSERNLGKIDRRVFERYHVITDRSAVSRWILPFVCEDVM